MNPRSGRLLTFQLNTKSRGGSPFNDAIWSVTFSDLITLLLCFFLTMVSFGPIGKAHRAQNLIESPQLPEESASSAPETPLITGTSLALTGSGVRKRVFELRREDLQRIGNSDNFEPLEEVKNIIKSKGYDNLRVTITVSPEVENDDQGQRWLSIIKRLSELQRQVFDAQPKTLLKLRIAEPYAPAGRGSRENSQNRERILGMIEIEDVSKSNG